jgi:hypothetical protein
VPIIKSAGVLHFVSELKKPRFCHQSTSILFHYSVIHVSLPKNVPHRVDFVPPY